MSFKQTIAQFIARNSYRKPFDRLCALCTFYRNAFSNFNYDWNTNGESFVLSILADHFSSIKNPIIFDAGANIGDWANIAAKKFPNATIHSFEPIPSTFAVFKQNTQNLNNVKAINLGLSDKEETQTFAHNPDQNALSSILVEAYEDIHHINHKLEQGKLITGDSYCKKENVDYIHLLKVDTEGYEGHVFRGFQNMLDNKKIKVIQFEYGRAGIFCGCLLKTHYDILKGNYAIGKIYPNRVHFKDYSSMDEDFIGPNYLAVLKEEKQLIKTLATIH